jgi:hypothetical protein
MLELNEGNTNNFLIHGLGVSVAAILGFVLFWPLGVLLTIAAIGVFAGTNGLEVDTAGRRYRKFGRIWFVKFGTWERINDPVKVKLVLSSENMTTEQIATMTMMPGAYVPNISSKVLTYDILLVDSSGKSTPVYDFLQYGNAKKALQGIADGFGIERVDKVAEKLEENRAKRSR